MTRLGTNGLDALAAWVDPLKPVFMSIDDGGVVSRIQTPVKTRAPQGHPATASRPS